MRTWLKEKGTVLVVRTWLFNLSNRFLFGKFAVEMFFPSLFWWKFLLFVWHRFLFREFLAEKLFSNRFWQTCFRIFLEEIPLSNPLAGNVSLEIL